MKETSHSKSEFSHLAVPLRCNVYGFRERRFNHGIIYVHRRRRSRGRRYDDSFSDGNHCTILENCQAHFFFRRMWIRMWYAMCAHYEFSMNIVTLFGLFGIRTLYWAWFALWHDPLRMCVCVWVIVAIDLLTVAHTENCNFHIHVVKPQQ